MGAQGGGTSKRRAFKDSVMICDMINQGGEHGRRKRKKKEEAAKEGGQVTLHLK